MVIDMSHPLATFATLECSSLGNEGKLKWKRGNAKLRKNTIHLSIPAGWTCKPWATKCYTHANPIDGKITDGKEQKFRCYAASMEAVYPNLRKLLWNNYKALAYHAHEPLELYKLLLSTLLPHIKDYYEDHQNLPKVRIFGTSGDFWHENMYLACVAMAKALSPLRVYWYTKAIPLWIKHRNKIPDNLVQNASLGGRFDNLIHKHKLKYAKVVYSFEEAKNLGLPIDKKDELASEHGGPFAIPLHGTQPKGSEASKSLQALKKQGFHGYSKRKTVKP